MEKNLRQYYINAVDLILDEKELLSNYEYQYAYRLVYSKYKGLGNIADVLKKSIETKMSRHCNIQELFNSKVFSDTEIQTIINYWVSSAFANSANKNKARKEPLFINVVNRDYNKLSYILASKQYTDEHGVVYNGSEIFKQVNIAQEEQSPINENPFVAAAKIALSVGVWFGLDALSPKIAKKVPGICSLVRNCAEKYPIATKIANYTISPFDLDEFIKQDKINKGEQVDEEEGNYQDSEENFDDYDVVMEDGSVYDEYEDEVMLDSNSVENGKVYYGTFTDDDGENYKYSFEDRDA